MNTTHQTPHPLTQYDGMINTPSGKISLTHPDREQININDIAAGLANKCHFSGQVDPSMYFSIADHSMLVTQLVSKDSKNPYLLFSALLHDASEAYLGDMIKPLKVLDGMELFRKMERELTLCIFDACAIATIHINKIKSYDLKAQEIEYETFYKGAKLIEKFNSPKESYDLFLKTFYFLKYMCDINQDVPGFASPMIKLKETKS